MITPPNRGDLAKTLQVRRAAPPPPLAQRTNRVLQTANAPAQLSLFLRPANAR